MSRGMDMGIVAVNEVPPNTDFYRQCGIWMVCVFLLIPSVGCTSWKVKDAFEGEFSSPENNRIINDYCQSCHIHRTFSSSQHLDLAPQKYNRKAFRYATECRTCHFIRINIMTDVVERKTRSPEDANRGLFRDFELDQLKEQRERANQEVFKKPPIKVKEEEEKFLGIF